MKKLSVVLSVCLAIGVATPVVGQTASEQADTAKKDSPPSKAIEILKKVDAAAKAVKLISYKATFQPTGWLVARGYIPIEGSAVIAGECRDARGKGTARTRKGHGIRGRAVSRHVGSNRGRPTGVLRDAGSRRTDSQVVLPRGENPDREAARD